MLMWRTSFSPKKFCGLGLRSDPNANLEPTDPDIDAAFVIR
jgi:hypothetical protein